jgi:hypothetical protein
MVDKLAKHLDILLKLNRFILETNAVLGDLGLGTVAWPVEEPGSRLLTAFHPPIEIETKDKMI